MAVLAPLEPLFRALAETVVPEAARLADRLFASEYPPNGSDFF